MRNLSESSIYEEGSRIAELAVDEGLKRTQLRNLAIWASSGDASSVRYFIEKQVSRGIMSVNFGEELKSLLDTIDVKVFREIMLVAYDYYPWKRGEPVAKALFREMRSIERVVQGYSDRNRLGKVSIQVWFSGRGDGDVNLQVSFGRRVYNKGRVSRELREILKRNIPTLRNTPFHILIKN